jgi:osmotically-inducible protein OsmY
MKKFLLLTLMAAVVVQIGCTRESDRAEAGPEAVLTDDQLEQRIEAQFQADPALRPADLSIDADAEKGMVTLSGKVESEALRDRAQQIARDAHPNITVSNHIDVEPRELSRAEYTEEHAREQRAKAEGWGDKIGDSIDDAWIHTKLATKLVADADTPGRKINIDVNNNAVTLRGTVRTMEEKAEAERLAKETDGVKSVSNQLRVVAGS